MSIIIVTQRHTIVYCGRAPKDCVDDLSFSKRVDKNGHRSERAVIQWYRPKQRHQDLLFLLIQEVFLIESQKTSRRTNGVPRVDGSRSETSTSTQPPRQYCQPNHMAFVDKFFQLSKEPFCAKEPQKCRTGMGHAPAVGVVLVWAKLGHLASFCEYLNS